MKTVAKVNASTAFVDGEAIEAFKRTLPSYADRMLERAAARVKDTVKNVVPLDLSIPEFLVRE